MTYAQYGLVQASDYNALTGGPTSVTVNTLNAVWGPGATNAGYGQTALANVNIGDSVTASNWAALVNRTSSAATHQNSSITAVTAPVSGGVVTYLSAVPTNLTTIYTNRLNAVSQGTTSSTQTARTTSWTNSLTFTHTVTFASADQARYFFNAGGQLKVSCVHDATGTVGDTVFNSIATNLGTIVLSSPTGAGTATIAAVSYTGTKKVGGSGGTTNTTIGFYSLTGVNQTLASQLYGTGTYTSSTISVSARVSGAVVTITTVWTEVPPGGTVNGSASLGSKTTVTVAPPETTNLTNSWGTVTVAGSVTGT